MLKVFECFAGVGSQRMALRNLGIEHKVVGIAEIDKYALKSYEAIHGDCPNFGDISKINPNDLPNMDLFTYSFPCQDLSIAGKQKGLGEGTRSGLLYECEKVIEAKRPKYLLLENVKNLVGKKFKGEFDKWLKYLEGLGYKNYWKVINARDMGVPQNRERVFVVSILNDNIGYEFPKPIQLDKRIKDILENEVDEKYYMDKPFKLINKKNEIAELQIKAQKSIKAVQSENHICPTLTTMKGGHREPKILEVAKTNDSYEQNARVYGINGLSPTLAARDYKDSKKILVERISQQVEVRKYKIDTEDLGNVLKEHKETSKLSNDQISTKLNVTKTTVEHWFRSDDCFSIPSRDIWFKLKELLKIGTDKFDKSIMEFELKENEFDISNRVYRQEGISPTLMASVSEGNAAKILIPQATKKGFIEMEVGGVCDLTYPNSKTRRGRVQENGTVLPTLTASQQDIVNIDSQYRVRKLTPLECWRLMSFTDEDFYKAKDSGLSNSQLYKQAGNSIVVKVLEGIFSQLFLNVKEENKIDAEVVKLGKQEVEQFKWVI